MRVFGAELIEHGHDFHDGRCSRGRAGCLPKTASRPLVSSLVGTRCRLIRSGAVPGSARLGPGLRSNELGSGAAGLAGVRNALGLKTKIIAVVSSEVPSYARSMVAGRIVDVAPGTRIADGIAVARPHPGAFDLVRDEIERVVEVSGDAVEAAMRAHFRATTT